MYYRFIEASSLFTAFCFSLSHTKRKAESESESESESERERDATTNAAINTLVYRSLCVVLIFLFPWDMLSGVGSLK